MKENTFRMYHLIRSILIFLFFFEVVLCASAAKRIDSSPVYPSIWYKPDSAIVNPAMLDTIIAPEAYTMMVAYKLLKPNTTQPLWTMTTDSTSFTIATEKSVISPVIYTRYHTIARGTTMLDSCLLYNGANQDSTSHIQLYETAYFPISLTRPQALMFQTYLALKHGITLNHSNYLSTQGKVIWDARKNRDYHNHIQGIGADPFYRYYSLNSVSVEDSVLTVSTTDSILPYSYALVGDNNAPMDWMPYEGSLAMLQRRWMMRSTGMLPELTLTVSTHMFPDDVDTLLLALLSEEDQIISYISPSSIDSSGVAVYMLPSSDIDFSFVSRFEYVSPRTRRKNSANSRNASEDAEANITLSPTFTHGEFTLDITLDKETQIIITIHDGAGKLIQRHELASLLSYQFNGFLNNQGVYLISVSDKDSNILYSHQLIVY